MFVLGDIKKNNKHAGEDGDGVRSQWQSRKCLSIGSPLALTITVAFASENQYATP